MNGNLEDVEDEPNENNNSTTSTSAQLELANNISLISKQAASMLAEIPGETLEKKLSAILAQNKTLQTTVKEVGSELEEERARYAQLNNSVSSRSAHLTTEMEAEITRKFGRFFGDYRSFFFFV